MLVLGRRAGEAVVAGNVIVRVLAIKKGPEGRGHFVKLGIVAPADERIQRVTGEEADRAEQLLSGNGGPHRDLSAVTVINTGKRMVGGTLPDEPTCHDHEWAAFSTALLQRWVMVQCVRCGQHGTVDDPSPEEWSAAYRAPSAPYRWPDDARVTRRAVGPLYVRTGPSGYERLPREVVGRLSPLAPDEREELLALAEFVEGSNELDSGLFPLFVTSFQQDTGAVAGRAVKHLTARIGQFDCRGLRLTPAQVAWVLRCHATESPPARTATPARPTDGRGRNNEPQSRRDDRFEAH